MSKRIFDPKAPYQTISGAARITGLSQYYIRTGCKSGTVPHIKCGDEYRICMPQFLAQLEEQALKSAQKKRLTNTREQKQVTQASDRAGEKGE